MSLDKKAKRLFDLYQSLEALTDGQIGWVERVVTQFRKPIEYRRLPDSDLLNECVLRDFGDVLRIHHCFSSEAFSKDKFEYALERVSNLCGLWAELAPRGNPGHDITINGVRFSLKTQADKSLKETHLHISKFMELGKGQWGDNESDLEGLRDQFFHHLRSYDRILSLRQLKTREAHLWRYELVEIPKPLLEEAKYGTLRMIQGTSQFPKPGYCDVNAANGGVKFRLYFDGGTERKLQIKNIDKAYCLVHTQWSFESVSHKEMP